MLVRPLQLLARRRGGEGQGEMRGWALLGNFRGDAGLSGKVCSEMQQRSRSEGFEEENPFASSEHGYARMGVSSILILGKEHHNLPRSD